MTTYRDELRAAMTMLSQQPGVVFMGQAVRYPGTEMYRTLDHLPEEQRLELPVFENTQLGMATGMSLAGLLPVCVYPRINFLLEATGQLVQHLDALPRYSDYRPKVIIRTAVAHDQPLNPGVQHLGDFSHSLRSMLLDVRVWNLNHPDEVAPSYRSALLADHSTILVEYTRLYDQEWEETDP